MTLSFFVDRQSANAEELAFDGDDAIVRFILECKDAETPSLNRLYLLLSALLDALPAESTLHCFAEYARNVLLLRSHHVDAAAGFFRAFGRDALKAQLVAYVPGDEVDYYFDNLEKRAALEEKLSHKYFPRVHALFENIEQSCDDYLMRGIACAPLVTDSTDIMTMGSCFAQNINRFLSRTLGRKAMHLSVGEELDSLSFLDTVGRLSEAHPELAAFVAAAEQPLLIYTIGIAEVLVDAEGGVYSVGKLKGNPALARRKQASILPPQAIASQVRAAFSALRRLNPALRVVMTVSPVPLETTFRSDLSVIAADCLSKATLRHAVELATQPDDGIYYFPSFEFVRWLCPLIGLQPFAEDDGHPRHVSNRVVLAICLLFVKYFGSRELYGKCAVQSCSLDAVRTVSVEF